MDYTSIAVLYHTSGYARVILFLALAKEETFLLPNWVPALVILLKPSLELFTVLLSNKPPVWSDHLSVQTLV